MNLSPYVTGYVNLSPYVKQTHALDENNKKCKFLETQTYHRKKSTILNKYNIEQKPKRDSTEQQTL